MVSRTHTPGPEASTWFHSMTQTCHPGHQDHRACTPAAPCPSPPTNWYRALKVKLCPPPSCKNYGDRDDLANAVIADAHGGNCSVWRERGPGPGPRPSVCSRHLPCPTNLSRTGTEPERARRAHDKRLRRLQDKRTMLHHLLTDTKGQGTEAHSPQALVWQRGQRQSRAHRGPKRHARSRRAPRVVGTDHG